jgi:hypothetical protein
MDKILNYKNNQQWIDGYFEKSIFKGQTKILLLLLTFLEITAGLLCLTGVFFSKNLVNPIGFYGLFLCSISFLSLFLGQRIAKDYAGAANIPGYFVVSFAPGRQAGADLHENEKLLSCKQDCLTETGVFQSRYKLRHKGSAWFAHLVSC